ncbi:hypothetical protein G4B88_023393 [Cannabis sativa]|uniref:DUF4283 domain-containing protein n=1 Tax=Cannabis sativa TaxID=3483 RepID=A0A7J6I1T7_CANSA|nr:hypothetical protein G4B88_023393 [Cannabis sativa]
MQVRSGHGHSGHGWHRNPTGFGKKKGHYPTGSDWPKNPGSLSDQENQKYWSFRTIHKVFMITLSNDGGYVRICERTRLSGYEIVVTLDAATWLIETLEVLQKREEKQRMNFKRTFRNNSNVCFLESFQNSRGVFIRISVLKNNRITLVIIPEERQARGWSELARCLNGVLKRSIPQKYKIQKSLVEEEEFVRSGGLKPSYANIVKQPAEPSKSQSGLRYYDHDDDRRSRPYGGRNKLPKQDSHLVKRKYHKPIQNWTSNKLGYWDFLPKENGSFRPRNMFPRDRMEQEHFHEYLQAEKCDKDWNRALIMFRDNSKVGWSVIFYNLSREIDRKLVVSQMYDDRTIIWCKNEEEMESLLKLHKTAISGTGGTIVSLIRWSMEEQNRDIKIECRSSWMGVEELPLNLWNIKFMGKIGELCGGLLDVEKDTAEKTFLHHLRLKLGGDEDGFVPKSIRILNFIRMKK